LPGGIYLYLNYYSLNTDDSLNTDSTEGEVRSLFSYSIDNKVFGCHLNATPFLTTESGKRISISAPIITLYFTDKDGDGRFETMFISSALQLKVPNWAIVSNK
jgi:hypothetical protein